MKYLFFLFVTLLALQSATAQSKVEAPGKIDKADLVLSDCPFDPGAEAYKLIDRRKVFYDRGTNLFKMVVERQTRIKILKDKGLSYANVHIPYYSRNNEEKITKIEAYTYNLAPDGSVAVTQLDKASFFSKKITKNFSETIIAFPEAKVGSVIEYKYTLERENFLYVEDWYFQDEIPVRYSSHELKAPLLFKFVESPFIYSAIDKKEDTFSDYMVLNGDLTKVQTLQQIYTMQNLPGIKQEPYMPSPNDYMQRISFQLAQIDYGEGNVKDIRTTWQHVAAKLMSDEDFGEELAKEIPAALPLVTSAKLIADPLERMLKIYNELRNNINWNGTHSIYAFSGLRTVWDKKTGSTGDINALLINLLNQAGITAKPLLASTRSNGLISTAYASEKQFNTLMAYVYIGQREYVLNAADKYTPYQLMPHEITNTKTWVLGPDGTTGWLDVFPRHSSSHTTVVQATIGADGTMKGAATITSRGYAKMDRCKGWMEDKSGHISNYFIKPHNKITIEKATVKNATNDSLGLEEALQFTKPLSSSGNYQYFTINLFAGLHVNPFTDSKRISDIDFGYLQEYTLYGSYAIPENFAWEALPKDAMIITPDTGIIFNSNFMPEDNLLKLRISIQFKRPYYLADDYPAVQDFYKKLFAKLDEQIVIVKK